MIIVKQKINDRMNNLQVMMESQTHLTSPKHVLDCIESVAKFWPVLSEEDKEYIEGCRYAIENKLKWDKNI